MQSKLDIPEPLLFCLYMAVDLEDIRRRLQKKATFEAALADLQKQLRDNPTLAGQDAVFDLIKRISTLLKTRYTSPAFWRAGRSVFETAKVGDVLSLHTADAPMSSKYSSTSP